MTHPPTPPVVPVTDDLDTGPFFAAAGEGRLVICECAGCGRPLHMPMRWCHRCASAQVRWREVAPTGTVYSFSVVTHQVHPAFGVPYTLVLVELDEEPRVRLVGHLDGRAPIAIGDAVTASFLPVGDSGAGMPVWSRT